MKKKSTIEELKKEGLVKNASEISPKDWTINFAKGKYKEDKVKWISEIETYCGENGILPNDLIETHKSRNKPLKSKKGTNTPKNDGSAENGSKTGNTGHSNWFEGYRKTKLGIK